MCVAYQKSELMKRVERALIAGVEVSPRLRAEVERWLAPFEKGMAIGRIDGALDERSKERGAVSPRPRQDGL